MPTLVSATSVGISTLPLGVFLAARVHPSCADTRFDTIELDCAVFPMTWTLQAVWIVVSLGRDLRR